MNLDEIEQPGETPEETPKQRILRMRHGAGSPRVLWLKSSDNIEEREEKFEINLACFGDYDNSSMVERSNSAYLVKKYPKMVLLAHGGHGSVITYVTDESIRRASQSDFERFKEDIESLDNYPCLDDDLMSSMEMEAYDEYWESDGYKELRKKLLDTYAYSAEEKVAVMTCDKDDLYRAVLDLDDGGDMFMIEGGGSVYFRVARAAEKIAHAGITELLSEDPSYFAELAQRDAWNNGLRDQFLKTIGLMYAKRDPGLASQVGQLEDEAAFRLMVRLAKKAEVEWTADIIVDPPRLELDEQDLVDMAAVLRPEDMRHLRPESPAQSRFKFAESVVNRMI